MKHQAADTLSRLPTGAVENTKLKDVVQFTVVIRIKNLTQMSVTPDYPRCLHSLLLSLGMHSVKNPTNWLEH